MGFQTRLRRRGGSSSPWASPRGGGCASSSAHRRWCIGAATVGRRRSTSRPSTPPSGTTSSTSRPSSSLLLHGWTSRCTGRARDGGRAGTSRSPSSQRLEVRRHECSASIGCLGLLRRHRRPRVQEDFPRPLRHGATGAARPSHHRRGQRRLHLGAPPRPGQSQPRGAAGARRRGHLREAGQAPGLRGG